MLHPRVAAGLCAGLFILPLPAHGFCGTFVGQAGANLYNHSSQVVLARVGDQTALTLAFDYEGALEDFALIIPVPEVLTAADVSLPGLELVKAADAYSGPRLVTYQCSDFYYYDDYGGGGLSGCGCSDSYAEATPVSAAAQDATTVVVEETFTAGAYEIAVLSAEESSDLFTWLSDNGYAPPPGGDALLQQYIDAGSYFLAAKIALDEVLSGRQTLSPIQLRYESQAFSLPVRIGTLSADSEQHLIIYTLTPGEEGEVAISNYDAVSADSDCMWRAGADEKFSDFYARWFEEATDVQPEDGRAVYLKEYSWNASGCDPCSSDPLTASQLDELGYAGDAYNVQFTRIHMRYRPNQIVDDLNLYTTGMQTSSQIRFVVYDWYLEDQWPVCGEGWAANPGSCDEARSAGLLAPPPPRADRRDPRHAGASILITLAAGVAAMRRRLR